MILGDWNAHHSAWHSPWDDNRGDKIADVIENSDLCVLNEDSHTRLPTGANNNQRASSPDVSLISAHLALSVDWSVSLDLTSDHLPIVISFDDDTPLPRFHQFTNYKKANWRGYKNELESLVDQLPLPTSCASGEKAFRKVIQHAAKHHIPSGFVKNFTPGKSQEIIDLEQRFNSLRQANPQDPALPDLSREIREKTASTSRSRWRDFATSLDRRSEPRRLWTVMQRLSGKKKSAPPNQPIKFGNRIYTKRSAITRRFNIQYSNVRPHSSSPIARKIKRKLDRTHRLNNNAPTFTLDNTVDAIKNAKHSTAVGPDGLCILHYKNMGRKALEYLTSLFNLSIANPDLPAIWKRSIILPVLKPGKPATEGPSYRPISLLCPASKLLERLLLPNLQSTFQLNENQHGFRSLRSTSTALLPLVTEVAAGFNERKPPKRTIAAAIDLSKAFDVVNHDILITKICESGLDPNIVRWLSTFLKGREQAVIYNGYQSTFKRVHRGVPQGGVLSPMLFNLYVADFPRLQSSVTTFADDTTIYASGVDITVLERQITDDLDAVFRWAQSIDFDIAPSKSSVTLFSPSTHEHKYHPQVFINGVLLPLEKNPKLLGVVLDPLFTFSPHVRHVAKKANERLRVIKALAGSSWGQDKETMLITYKSLIRSNLDYAAPIWSPNVKPTPLDRLQCIQNASLRVVTGCHKMASEAHLHAETYMLPVSDHLRMISAQFLASCSRASHPSYNVISAPDGPRQMKQTLQSAHRDSVDVFLTNGALPAEAYNNAKQIIHADFVEASLDKQEVNPLLQRRPPPVHPSESRLPRAYRASLSQLRSGYSNLLNSYKFKIGASLSATCPRCGDHDDTVPHLFECTANPTSLNLASLWLYPLDVATFLSSLNFPDLPPLPPPPPEPPPSPQPSPDSALFSPLSLGQSFYYSSISSSNESLGNSPDRIDLFLAND